MVACIITALICGTVIFCITRDKLPAVRLHTEYRDCTPQEVEPPKASTIGFTQSEEEEPHKSDKELQEELMKDVASTVTALMNGEIELE